MKRRKRRSRFALYYVLLFVTVALLTVLFSTGYEVSTQLQEYQAARSEYADLREQFGIVTIPVPTPEGESEPDTDAEPEDAGNAEGIDFDALRTLNPGIVGWLVVPGTGISYPMVQGSNNSRYLHHTFLGVRNNSGAIFLDYRSAPDFTDAFTIVYGHNMQDGSMFAPLHGWAGDHFIIHTPDRVMTFEVFDRQTVTAYDELFQLRNAPADNGVRVVMLSTCVNGRPSMRYVIQAQLRDNLSQS